MISKNLENVQLENFPIVIFGSGPAGMSTALELEKKKIKCLLIEAGGEYFSENSQKLYSATTIGDDILSLSESRLRQLGGTSGIWGGVSKPLENYTFDKWPIRSDDLNAYSERTCEILDIKNQFRKSQVNKYMKQVEFQYSKVNFAEKYKDHIESSQYIMLVLNTQLSHFSGENQSINHAVCVSENKEIKIKAKYFILSCGGIENSRLLLWTQNKNPGLLSNNMPIGKFWMNHPHVLGGRGVISRKKFKQKMPSDFVGFSDWMHFSTTKKFIEEKNILSASMYMLTQDVFRKENFIDKEVVKDIFCVAPKYGEKLIQKFHKEDFTCVNIYLLLEHEPSEENKVILDTEKDRFQIPKPKLFYKKTQKSLKTAKFFLDEFAGYCLENDFGRIAIKESIFNEEKLDLVGDGGHHMGGTRMGTDKNNSVVDSNLKVHGINNLYINGSSNFYTGGYTNPTFTIIQLALRLANKIQSNFG